MALTLAEVNHIAELAHLALDDAEKALFQEQLSDILDYAAQLQALNTESIPPTATVLPLRSVLRDDEPASLLSREDALANAQESFDGCFVVPALR